MNAIRQVVKVKNRRVTVELPADFIAEEVEVIVLPAATPEPVGEAIASSSSVAKKQHPRPKLNRDQDEQNSPLTKLQQLLLDAPAMNEEEYEFIMEKRRALNAWK